MAKKKASAKKTASKKAPKKKKAAQASEDGRVTLADLATEAGISGQAARQKLRAAEFARPEGGRWSWRDGSKELRKVRDTLGL